MTELQVCMEFMVLSFLVPGTARALTKSMLRQATIEKLLKKRQQDVDAFVKLVTSSTTQEVMGVYMESLRKKSKKQK